jgi:hypothetical protein
VIVLLALAWGVVLLPTVARPRFESSPISSVGEFERSMGILASTRYGRQQVPGRWVMVPKGMSNPRSRRARLIEKRRRTFLRLLIAASATLVLGLIPALRVLWLAHLGLDVAIAGYVFQLRRWRAAEIQRARVLRALPKEPSVEPDAHTDSVSGSA